MSGPTTLRAVSGLPADPPALSASSLVMIDCQNTYTRGLMELEGVQAALDQAEQLLDRARSAGIPVIHIQHDAGPGRPTTCARRSGRSSTGSRRGPGSRRS
ncbi:MAG TPA: isochorismatase family protein [Microbacteriaceae bacterium]|nr:isochorismatase family protein [Microbacteriaceae bacterium]